jgi:hypothetical protein
MIRYFADQATVAALTDRVGGPAALVAVIDIGGPATLAVLTNDDADAANLTEVLKQPHWPPCHVYSEPGYTCPALTVVLYEWVAVCKPQYACHGLCAPLPRRIRAQVQKGLHGYLSAPFTRRRHFSGIRDRLIFTRLPTSRCWR